ncbi:AbrB/MazE/SpoVT family DNA-binding domain-containing protein [Azospirillum sp. A1-3]|uniref:AbrB/MazE/SpoVT family DNA-binding domain-containing protein n=1 Tax=Azospirillum sp. A1-3 TaxID=185874 RepID=UPI00207747AB|nr:AbrB/MazE/SpoVT family DNA-binding domain-containing protein [Azospirillum sp. A1-3]MCM8735790.1 AbrB/MazE/SpoVT family DNA-binding domain-containing protein [Azospirillum sp. A1-3]
MHIAKLTRIGNSTGLTLPREMLAAAHLDCSDEVTIKLRDGRIQIAKAGNTCNHALDIGRYFAARYRRTMSILSK